MRAGRASFGHWFGSLLAAGLVCLALPAVGRAQTYYTPNNIRSAYGFNKLATSVTGAGQTIAILDFGDDPTVRTDLSSFNSTFGISGTGSLTVENENGSTTASALPSAGSADFQQETALDVEFAHSIAPGANIVLVELPANATVNDFITGAQTANKVASVVSLSIGFTPNQAGETTLDQYLNVKGVTYTSAAGDKGDMNFPGTSPYVISVGGTSLTINNTAQPNTLSSTGGTRGAEVVWNDSHGSSGGGIDPYETQPEGQQGASGVVGTSRNIPDVAYDADLNTGELDVYNGQFYGAGGTSIGAPQWAGLIALADQVRVTNGLATLSTTQALDLMYNAYKNNPTLYASLFNDITSGSNTAGDTATTGYDDVSGLGTPNADALIAYLGTAAVPEPTSACLLLAATAPLIAARRRRRPSR